MAQRGKGGGAGRNDAGDQLWFRAVGQGGKSGERIVDGRLWNRAGYRWKHRGLFCVGGSRSWPGRERVRRLVWGAVARGIGKYRRGKVVLPGSLAKVRTRCRSNCGHAI